MPIENFSLACTAILCCASLDPSDLEAVGKARKVVLLTGPCITKSHSDDPKIGVGLYLPYPLYYFEHANRSFLRIIL